MLLGAQRVGGGGEGSRVGRSPSVTQAPEHTCLTHVTIARAKMPCISSLSLLGQIITNLVG